MNGKFEGEFGGCVPSDHSAPSTLRDAGDSQKMWDHIQDCGFEPAFPDGRPADDRRPTSAAMGIVRATEAGRRLVGVARLRTNGVVVEGYGGTHSPHLANLTARLAQAFGVPGNYATVDDHDRTPA